MYRGLLGIPETQDQLRYIKRAGYDVPEGFVPASALVLPDGDAVSITNHLPVAATQRIETAGFSASGASVLDVFFVQTPQVGAGVTYNQASGSLNILTGTTTNAEFLARSVNTYWGSMRLRASIVASQRIANQNFAVILADLLGEGLTYTINSSTSVTVATSGLNFNATMVGQFVFLGGITGAAGVPGRYAIASVSGDNITFTVAGWPASGTGTLTLFGRNYVRNLVNGVTPTNVAWDVQCNGWATGDTTATINTTASPGTILQNELTGRDAWLHDALRATSTSPNYTVRASRYENIPEPDTQFYVFLWSYNGTTAPASTTTWTLGHVTVEQYPNQSFYIQGVRPQGAVNPLPTSIIGSTNAALLASVARVGFNASHGIWYDDSSTVLAANATFTGTSRDLLVTATATAFTNVATFAEELRVSAESDQSGTLWVEVSRDNTNWRRVKSVATAAVTGGGQYAEILLQPSWRYARVGFTNGATLQTRFTIGSITMGA